jgi:hypothetical protein
MWKVMCELGEPSTVVYLFELVLIAEEEGPKVPQTGKPGLASVEWHLAE